MKKLLSFLFLFSLFISCTTESTEPLPMTEKSRELTDVEVIDSIANSIPDIKNPYDDNYEVPADANVSWGILCKGKLIPYGSGATVQFMVRYNPTNRYYEFGFYFSGRTQNGFSVIDTGGWLWAQYMCCCSGYI